MAWGHWEGLASGVQGGTSHIKHQTSNIKHQTSYLPSSATTGNTTNEGRPAE